jgi:hypothetical protein
MRRGEVPALLRSGMVETGDLLSIFDKAVVVTGVLASIVFLSRGDRYAAFLWAMIATAHARIAFDLQWT